MTRSRALFPIATSVPRGTELSAPALPATNGLLVVVPVAVSDVDARNAVTLMSTVFGTMVDSIVGSEVVATGAEAGVVTAGVAASAGAVALFDAATGPTNASMASPMMAGTGGVVVTTGPMNGTVGVLAGRETICAAVVTTAGSNETTGDCVSVTAVSPDGTKPEIGMLIPVMMPDPVATMLPIGADDDPVVDTDLTPKNYTTE